MCIHILDSNKQLIPFGGKTLGNCENVADMAGLGSTGLKGIFLKAIPTRRLTTTPIVFLIDRLLV